MTMDRPRLIEDLADELLSDIVSFLVPGTGTSTGRDYYENQHHRSSAKPESTAFCYGEGTDLDRFRLVCKRFMRIGTPWKFPRFVLRFSNEGFKRLEDLLDMQLACHTRYFTYMVRPFYRGSGTVSELPAYREKREGETRLTDIRRLGAVPGRDQFGQTQGFRASPAST